MRMYRKVYKIQKVVKWNNLNQPSFYQAHNLYSKFVLKFETVKFYNAKALLTIN